MPRTIRPSVVICAALLVARWAAPLPLVAQDMPMDHAEHAASDTSRAILSAGASAILLGTRASPAVSNRDLTEGYLTQPMLMGSAELPAMGLEAAAIIDFEGLTLRRGELNAGMFGEGYVDRRHPHTYLHELVGTWKRTVRPRLTLSATAGKGFVPFGTDDPMSRPFVKYPVNHHLAQILERAIIVGSAAAGPFVLEASRFNGDEPDSPSDWPNADRLFDSWSARATARFWEGSEIQASFARVLSPEVSAGGGLTQRKWSASGRYESDLLYGLAEFARTQEFESGRDAFSFTTMLAEGSVKTKGLTVSARGERTERPEEERLANPFRTARPASDLSILGRTRWTVFGANVSRQFDLPRGGRFSPFVEVSRAHAAAIGAFSIFDPKGFYGSDVMWSISAGVKLGVGMMHDRMGRYGAAIAPHSMTMKGMEM
jgi:hypothetical protein